MPYYLEILAAYLAVAIGVDAFQRSWGSNYNYIYPAFSLIGMVLKKIQEDGGGVASGILMDNVTLVPKIAGTSSGLTRLLPN